MEQLDPGLIPDRLLPTTDSNKEPRKYTYRPLEGDFIRILILQPGEFGAPLYGKLLHVRLPSEMSDDDEDDNNIELPQYEAISYAWGSAEFTHHITLNRGTVLKITISLYQALQRFRFRGCRRRLWTDAICIDQDNHLEKSSQVRKMGQIYKQAQETLVWLGESDGLDWLAFGVFAVIDDRFGGGLWSGYRMNVEEFGCELTGLRQSCVCCPTVPIDNASVAMQLAAQAIETFFNRPWFTRLWVVQEYALSESASLHCGSHSYNTEHCLWDLFEWHNYHGKNSPFSSAALDGIVQFMPGVARSQQYPRDNSLVDLFHETATRVCSDARDRIFAIKDLCQARTWPEAVPDYEIEPDVLFARIVSKCLAASEEIGEPRTYHPAVLMALAPATRAGLGGLRDIPSWVPDLQRLDLRSCRSIWRRYTTGQKYTTGQTYEETLLTHFGAFVSRILSELHMCGIMCGTVMYTPYGSQVEFTGRKASVLGGVDELRVFPDREELVDWLRRCGQFWLETHGVSSRDRASDTSLGTCDRAEYPHSPEGQTNLLIHLLADVELDGRGPLSELEIEHFETLFSRGFGSALNFEPGRLFSMIQTDTAPQFGWVPPDAQQGDELWFFKGCPWPFVLRHLPESEAYQIIGDASFPHLLAIQDKFEYRDHDVVYIR